MKVRSKGTAIRLIVGAAAAATLIVPLAACGSNTAGGSSEKVNISFYSYFKKDQIGDVVKGFEKANPNVHIDVQYGQNPSQYLQTLQTRISANKPPTIFNITMDNRTDVMKSGAALDLKGSSFLKGIADSNFNLFTLNNKIYGMPVTAWMGEMFYNKDILKDAGYKEFPKTWDDFIAMGKKINSMGKNAFLEDFNTQPSGTLEALLASYYASQGNKVQDEKIFSGKSTFEKEWIGPLTEWDNAVKAGVIPKKSIGLSADQVKQAFLTGQVAVMRSGSWDLPDIIKSGVKFGVAPMPAFKDGEQWINGGPDQGFAISAKATAKQQDAAKKFLTYLNSKPGLEAFTKAAGTVSLSDVYRNEPPSQLKMVYEKYFKPNHFYWVNFAKNPTAMSDTMIKLQQQMVNGQITPADFAKAMDKQWNGKA